MQSHSWNLLVWGFHGSRVCVPALSSLSSLLRELKYEYLWEIDQFLNIVYRFKVKGETKHSGSHPYPWTQPQAVPWSLDLRVGAGIVQRMHVCEGLLTMTLRMVISLGSGVVLGPLQRHRLPPSLGSYGINMSPKCSCDILSWGLWIFDSFQEHCQILNSPSKVKLHVGIEDSFLYKDF